MSRTSSASWKATPSRSPYWVSTSTTVSSAPDIIAPKRHGDRDQRARSCRRGRRGSARPGRGRRAGPAVSRIWPVTSRSNASGLDAYGLGPEVGQDVRGAGEQEVTGEDGDRVAPAGVGAGHAAPHLGLVHHVVVVQRRQVGQLDHHRRRARHPARTGRRTGRPASPAAAGTACRPARTRCWAASVMKGTSLLVASSSPSSTAASPAWTSASRAWSRTLSPNGPTTVTRGLLSAVSLTITRFVDVSLPSLKSAYPVTFRSPRAPTGSPPGGRGPVRDRTPHILDQLIRADIHRRACRTRPRRPAPTAARYSRSRTPTRSTVGRIHTRAHDPFPPIYTPFTQPELTDLPLSPHFTRLLP